MCSSREKSIPSPRKVIGNSEGERGGGSFFAKILEAKYEAKLEFPRGRGGGGVKNKKPSVGGVWIFSGTALY